MNLESRIEAIGRSIGTIVERLNEHGFEFERPDDVFPGPEAGAAEAMERIERETGILPFGLKQFWLRVGSVDLCGAHPGWAGCEYPDPLVIAPPSFAVGELEDFLADREERQRHQYPYVVPIAPDFYHKADVSGGMFYNISVPAVADDPPLNDGTPQHLLITWRQQFGGEAFLAWRDPQALVAHFATREWNQELTKSQDRTRASRGSFHFGRH
jgi:hypothetical protein